MRYHKFTTYLPTGYKLQSKLNYAPIIILNYMSYCRTLRYSGEICLNPHYESDHSLVGRFPKKNSRLINGATWVKNDRAGLMRQFTSRSYLVRNFRHTADFSVDFLLTQRVPRQNCGVGQIRPSTSLSLYISFPPLSSLLPFPTLPFTSSLEVVL